MKNPQDWGDVNLRELFGVMAMSAFVGVVRFFYLLRRGRRKFQWFDLILEPCLAILAGTMVWALSSLTDAPILLKLVLMQLGAWGGPRTIHAMERRYMGGSRREDTKPGDLL